MPTKTQERPERAVPPWWRSGWFITLVLVGVLHATGQLVHVQAALQRVVLMTGLFAASSEDASARPPADMSLSLVRDDGTPVQLDSLRGEVVFVNFWASWCPPCLAEMPTIDGLHDVLGDRATFLMVSLDADREQARAYAQSRDFGFDVYFPASRIPRTMTTGTLPTTVVVDRRGRMAVHHEGMARYDSADFVALMEDLLAEAP